MAHKQAVLTDANQAYGEMLDRTLGPLLVAGVGEVLQLLTGSGPVDPQSLFERFLPPHNAEAGNDPFAAVERELLTLSAQRQGTEQQDENQPSCLFFHDKQG